jgi:serine phosphatase RsbU (regulator of sigma subunit)/HAMP domain-containing protein
MFKKLAVRLSFALILIMGSIVTIFTVYLVNERSEHLKETILNKGIASAQTGARIMSEILDNVVENKIFTEDELFNFSLKPIPLNSEILAAYRKISIDKINNIQKYNYVTGLDRYLDTLISPIQDEFFKDPQVVFAVLCDNNGYTPTHNKIYDEPLTGDYEIDNERSRSKRIYFDPLVAQNKEEPYIFNVYHRDTGEEMWRISAPVFVKGKHWGSFRIGFSMLKTQEALNNLRKRLILMMGILLITTVLVINRATAFMMKPLGKLYDGVKRVAQGDLSYRIEIKTRDEIGDLAAAFNHMTGDLKKYIVNLQEATASKERIQSELKLGKDIQKRMLPHVFPPFPDRTEFDIFAVMEPAKEVAGDFYDFFFVDDNNFCFVISDVSGKGVPSALFMVIAKTLIKAEAQRGLPIEDVVFYVNNALTKNNDTAMFATLFLGMLNLETGELKMVNAGHNPPLLGNHSIGLSFINLSQNIALGVFEDFVFKPEFIQIKTGDQILLYTDGVTEAFNSEGEVFSDESLLQVVNNHQTDGSMQLVLKIQQEIKLFVKNADQSDDITILAVTYNGK